MLWDLAVVFLFILFAVVFVAANIIGSRILTWLFRIQKRDRRKHTTYECGETPIGEARVRFNNRFYLIALAFLIFDVEVVFVLPIAVIFQQSVLTAAIELGIFIAMLLVGLIYVWVNGDLDWVKPKARYTQEDVAT